MPDATGFARQWAGLVAQVRLLGSHVPGAAVIEAGGMVASVMPAAPHSSILNVALATDPTQLPRDLQQLAQAFRQGGARAWGLWVDGDHEAAREAPRTHLATAILQRLLLDARERGQRTASLQASQAGRPLYERIGFKSVGTLHLHEERFP